VEARSWGWHRCSSRGQMRLAVHVVLRWSKRRRILTSAAACDGGGSPCRVHLDLHGLLRRRCNNRSGGRQRGDVEGQGALHHRHLDYGRPPVRVTWATLGTWMWMGRRLWRRLLGLPGGDGGACWRPARAGVG
jgi:hypothetical protein